jgi:hypothetical protein
MAAEAIIFDMVCFLVCPFLWSQEGSGLLPLPRERAIV